MPPLPDGASECTPKLVELRELAHWSESMMLCSPASHVAMSSISKSQIDLILREIGAVRPSRMLAVMQASGGSH